MAGDGGLDALNEQISFLESCGVAAIELGVPFSDPVADGPTIQAAGERSLENGTTLTGVLDVLKQNKNERSVPIILMTYINPLFKYGIEKLAKDAAESGVSGIIIPDIPLEEESLLQPYLTAHEIAFIRLAAMTSPQERLIELAQRTEGFLYAVSVTGTTGARATHEDEVYNYLQHLKENCHTPVL